MEQTKLKPARKQVTRRKNLQREEGGGDYNIWYHKYLGQKRERWEDREPAETRCVIARDAGYTAGDRQKDRTFCVYFAKGCCSQGSECRFLHRLPNEQDEKLIPFTRDIFGRPKFATDRDDMGGVGSFNRECKTLYVSGLKNVPGQDMEEALERHFREWGPIDYVRVFPDRCYGFVKYKLRVSAEFAREAMAQQALDNDEVLNVKWATDDPNPVAKERNLMDRKLKLVEAIHNKGINLNDGEGYYPALPAPGAATTTAGEAGGDQSTTTTAEGTAAAAAAAPDQQQTLDYYNYYYTTYYGMQPDQAAAAAAAAMAAQAGSAEGDNNNEAGGEKKSGGGKGKYSDVSGKRETDYYRYLNELKKKHMALQGAPNAEVAAQWKQQEAEYQKEKAKLGSQVADPYPNTDAQFDATGGAEAAATADYYNSEAYRQYYYQYYYGYGQQQQQQQQQQESAAAGTTTTATGEQHEDEIVDPLTLYNYGTYDYDTYAKFAQLGGDGGDSGDGGKAEEESASKKKRTEGEYSAAAAEVQE